MKTKTNKKEKAKANACKQTETQKKTETNKQIKTNKTNKIK